jgi:S1-C subfamily serine protease
LPYVSWGDSDTARVGDWVVAIGNPFGLDATVSSGIISGRGRDMHLGPYDDFLQIDAAINLGNSGGPIFDLSGRVIGINTAIYSPNGGSVGIGFAVPSKLAQPVIEQLKTHGTVERGWLGVRIQDLTPEIARAFGLPKPEGGLVADVTAGGPAAQGGFAQGDVILSVSGQIVRRKRDLLLALAALPIGQATEMRVWRRNAEIVLRPVIGAVPPVEVMAPVERRTHRTKTTIGLKLGPLTVAQREFLGIPPSIRGAIVLSIDDDSAFLGLGIRPGDVIETINQQPVSSPADAFAKLAQAVASGEGNVLMLINRRGVQKPSADLSASPRRSIPGGGAGAGRPCRDARETLAHRCRPARSREAGGRFLSEKGAVIVAASDSRGTIADENGLDVPALVALKSRGRSVHDCRRGRKLSVDAVIDIPCEIWIPSARPDVIHEGNVARVQACVMAQDANIPCTAAAEQELAAREVLY